MFKRLTKSCISALLALVLFSLIVSELFHKQYMHEQASIGIDTAAGGVNNISGSFSIFSISNMWNATVKTMTEGMTADNTDPPDPNDPLQASSRTVFSTHDSKIFEHSANVLDQPDTIESATGIPFFWVVPKSGTSTFKSILLKCLNLRMASSTNQIDYDSYDRLQLVNLNGLVDTGGHFLNVNFGYLPGIRKAQEWKMAESGLVDVAVTSYLHEAVSDVFSPSHPARIFTIFRHPVLRLISAFHYQKIATWERTFDDTNLTLLEYASDSRYHVDNWMTRMLANRHSGPVRHMDYMYAKKVMKEKVLILWLDEIDDSMSRLLTFMGWEDLLTDIPPPADRKGGGLSGIDCLNYYLHSNPVNVHHEKGDAIKEDSEEWQKLKEINRFDLNLYLFAKELFDGEQLDLYKKMKSG